MNTSDLITTNQEILINQSINIRVGVIYITTNIKTGKGYVGQKYLNKEEFYKSTYYGSGVYLNRAIKKWGIGNFIREVLEENNISNLNKQEKYWIKERNTKVPNGYNLTDGGEGAPGVICSEETKRKRSIALSGPNNPMYGKHPSPETLEKQRKIKLGKKFSPEICRNMGLAHKGIRHTEEAKQKLSITHMGEKNPMYHKPVSEETRQKRSLKLKGKKRPPEIGRKISLKLTGRKQSIMHTRKVSEALKKYFSKQRKYWDKRLQNPKFRIIVYAFYEVFRRQDSKNHQEYYLKHRKLKNSQQPFLDSSRTTTTPRNAFV